MKNALKTVAAAITGLIILALLPEQRAVGKELSIAEMRWQQRVILISADGSDAHLQEQLSIVARWSGADDRDVTVVQVVGNLVIGARDTASSLRQRLGMPAHGFMLLLLGKDGHVALRSHAPVSASQLAQTIDAMPMRRAGQR